MALTSGDFSRAVELVFKKLQNKATTSDIRGYVNEPYNSPNYISSDFVYAEPIPTTAPAESTSVVQVVTNFPMIAVGSVVTPGESWAAAVNQTAEPEGQWLNSSVYGPTYSLTVTVNGVIANAQDYVFDYDAGVLYFFSRSGNPIPSGTDTVTVSGFRYVGLTGINAGNGITTDQSIVRDVTQVYSVNASFLIDNSSILLDANGKMIVDISNLISVDNTTIFQDAGNTIFVNPDVLVQGDGTTILTTGNTLSVNSSIIPQGDGLTILANGNTFSVNADALVNVDGLTILADANNTISVNSSIIPQGDGLTILANGNTFSVNAASLVNVDGDTIVSDANNTISVNLANVAGDYLYVDANNNLSVNISQLDTDVSASIGTPNVSFGGDTNPASSFYVLDQYPDNNERPQINATTSIADAVKILQRYHFEEINFAGGAWDQSLGLDYTPATWALANNFQDQRLTPADQPSIFADRVFTDTVGSTPVGEAHTANIAADNDPISIVADGSTFNFIHNGQVEGGNGFVAWLPTLAPFTVGRLDYVAIDDAYRGSPTNSGQGLATALSFQINATSIFAGNTGVNTVSMRQTGNPLVTNTYSYIRDDIQGTPVANGQTVFGSDTRTVTSGITQLTSLNYSVGNIGMTNASSQVYSTGHVIQIASTGGDAQTINRTFADLGLPRPEMNASSVVFPTSVTSTWTPGVRYTGEIVHTVRGTNNDGTGPVFETGRRNVLGWDGSTGIIESNIPRVIPQDVADRNLDEPAGDNFIAFDSDQDLSAAGFENEATVVQGLMGHDLVNYTVFDPASPDYSGRSNGTQYTTLRVQPGVPFNRFRLQWVGGPAQLSTVQVLIPNFIDPLTGDEVLRARGILTWRWLDLTTLKQTDGPSGSVTDGVRHSSSANRDFVGDLGFTNPVTSDLIIRIGMESTEARISGLTISVSAPNTEPTRPVPFVTTAMVLGNTFTNPTQFGLGTGIPENGTGTYTPGGSSFNRVLTGNATSVVSMSSTSPTEGYRLSGNLVFSYDQTTNNLNLAAQERSGDVDLDISNPSYFGGDVRLSGVADRDYTQGEYYDNFTNLTFNRSIPGHGFHQSGITYDAGTNRSIGRWLTDTHAGTAPRVTFVQNQTPAGGLVNVCGIPHLTELPFSFTLGITNLVGMTYPNASDFVNVEGTLLNWQQATSNGTTSGFTTNGAGVPSVSTSPATTAINGLTVTNTVSVSTNTWNTYNRTFNIDVNGQYADSAASVSVSNYLIKTGTRGVDQTVVQRVQGLPAGDRPVIGTVTDWDNNNPVFDNHEAVNILGGVMHSVVNYNNSGYNPTISGLTYPNRTNGTTRQYFTISVPVTNTSGGTLNFSGTVRGIWVHNPNWTSLTWGSFQANAPLGAVPSDGVVTGTPYNPDGPTRSFGFIFDPSGAQRPNIGDRIYIRFALESGDSITSITVS